MRIDQVPTPAYVIDEAKLVNNLEILKSVQERTGCKVLLAQKAFSMYATYPLISQYLAGTTASGLYEAKLGREEFGGEVHVFAPAFKDADLEEILEIADHIVFNSERQLRKHVDKCQQLESVLACVLIQSAPPKVTMPSMIPAQQVLASVFVLTSFQKTWWTWWMVCISIHSVSKIRMI